MTLLRSQSTLRLLAGTLAPLLLTPSLAAPARAADAAPAPADALCVVEFGDLSRTGDAELGSLVAAGFTRSLARTEASKVIAEDDRLRLQKELGLSGAPARRDRAQLADASGAGRVVYGTITSAKVTEGAKRHASVRMTVLVEEAETGRLLFGAVSEGVSAPAAASDDRKALLAQAVNNAAESFARYLADPTAGPRVVSESTDRRIQKDSPAADPAARPAPLVTSDPRQQRLTEVGIPDPVVVDIPGGTMDGRRESARRGLLSTKTLKMLVGGALFMGLLYLAGAGGFGATRPF